MTPYGMSRALFATTGSKVLAKSLKSGGVVLACRLPGFAGLVGREIQPDRRLGSEMSDRAKRAGVGGIFHTDELPAYGVTTAEVEAVRSLLAAGEGDAVIMVTGPQGSGGEGTAGGAGSRPRGAGLRAGGDAPGSARRLLGVHAAPARLGPHVPGDGCAIGGDHGGDAESAASFLSSLRSDRSVSSANMA